jgi:hypothetical protein
MTDSKVKDRMTVARPQKMLAMTTGIGNNSDLGMFSIGDPLLYLSKLKR